MSKQKLSNCFNYSRFLLSCILQPFIHLWYYHKSLISFLFENVIQHLAINKNYDLFIEISLPKLRVRKKKQNVDELIDDDPISNPYLKFNVGVYNVVTNRVISNIKKIFISNSPIYRESSWLSPQNFQHINSKLSNEIIVNLALKLKKFDQCIAPENLKSELFKKSESCQTTMQPDSNENEDNINHDKIKDKVCTSLSSCKNCAVCCFNALTK